MSSPTDYFFDRDLREVASNPEALRVYVESLKASLPFMEEPERKARTLGEIGVWLRILGELDEAEASLRGALQIVKDAKLGIRSEIQQKIRMAHIYQWKRSFDLSNALFAEVIEKCRTDASGIGYLAFALQHAGKNFFDQNRFQDALALFIEALAIRMQNRAPADQISSTEDAIAETKARLGR